MSFHKKVLICSMKILVVSATAFETNPFRQFVETNPAGNLSITFLVSGVGMVNTTYALTKALAAHTYDFVLQAGVGGSFSTALPLGAVTLVASETFGDLGAEDHDNYLDIFEMGLIDGNTAPYRAGKLTLPDSLMLRFIDLPRVTGLTVNTVSGNQDTIDKRKNKFNCDVESMEGAAFHLVCMQEQVPFAQVRAISNYVIPRDRSQWKMKEAITNLNEYLITLLHSLVAVSYPA